jgi:peroxiredoxin
MAQLRQDYQKFLRRDTVVIVVGPETKNQFRTYWQENDLPFIGLPDPKHSVLKTYGQEVNLFKMGRMPAQALIDRQGVVRFVHYGHSMSDIPENREILELIDQLNQEEKDANKKVSLRH